MNFFKCLIKRFWNLRFSQEKNNPVDLLRVPKNNLENKLKKENEDRKTTAEKTRRDYNVFISGSTKESRMFDVIKSSLTSVFPFYVKEHNIIICVKDYRDMDRDQETYDYYIRDEAHLLILNLNPSNQGMNGTKEELEYAIQGRKKRMGMNKNLDVRTVVPQILFYAPEVNNQTENKVYNEIVRLFKEAYHEGRYICFYHTDKELQDSVVKDVTNEVNRFMGIKIIKGF